MTKFKDFEKKVHENGTPKMRDWLLITEKYIGELNLIIDKTYSEEEKSMKIQKLNIYKIAEDLIKSKKVTTCTAMSAKLSNFVILYIVQNTWESGDKDGGYLHNLSPLIFRDKFIVPIDKLFLDLKFY